MFRNGFVRTGIFGGIFALLIRWVASPEWIERYYSQGFFPLLRLVWDYAVGSWLPVAFVYILILLLLVRWIRSLYRWSKRRGRDRWWAALAHVLGFLGWLVLTFLLLWGFNYGRVPVEDRLGLDWSNLPDTLIAEQVKAEARVLTTLRAKLQRPDSIPLRSDLFPTDQEAQLRQALEDALAYYAYPVVGRVRGRQLVPKGIFLHFSSAGLYLPWTGEGHIDAGLLPLQQAYVLTHELAHGYGFGDEGTCSFWAYLASYYVESPTLVYTIRLGYWRSLAAAWSRQDRAAYLAFRATLPPGIRADLEAINANILAYPDWTPVLRDVAYDAYLRSQGITEGLANYSKVIKMVEAWRRTDDGFPGK
ncbi:MAG: DUF3810 family protein [Bacteroidota bacterium]